MTDYKKLAEEIVRDFRLLSGAQGFNELTLDIAFHLARVQRETLEAKIEWPSDEKVLGAAIENATKTVWHSVQGGEFKNEGTVVDPDMRDAFMGAIQWLRENVKLK